MKGIGYLAALIFLVLAGQAQAAQSLDLRRSSNIALSKHNLSTSGTGTVKSAAEASGGTSQICVFCHTPHGATQEAGLSAPLWNKTLSTENYVTYSSTSIQATIDANPGGASKLCLSCHDGTLAIGTVNVLEGTANQTVTLQNTGAGGTMPGDSTSGFTRDLGIDLTNDHPISLTYDKALATADGELYDPTNAVAKQGDQVGVRGSGLTSNQPRLPLEGSTVGSGKVQCTTCHDPHLVGAGNDAGAKIKFLRANRFQLDTEPTDGAFEEDRDIVCLACHNKQGWGFSAHARNEVADEVYKPADAQTREFPNTLDGDLSTVQVWEAACLNCHDTHTKQGARRLLREGSTGSSQANSAIEETCYQCHADTGTSILADVTTVPDIKTDFTTPGNRHMPIETADQQVTTEEIHDIKDADFTEDPSVLAQRHAECTDCHNPHRLKKTRKFSDTPGATEVAGTHEHTGASPHTNIASGVLNGTFGVEPSSYEPFESDPVTQNSNITFNEKKGVGTGCNTTADDPDTCTHVSREYQVCLKCHSNYAWGNSPPNLRPSSQGGSQGQNGVIQVTNQAMEFQAPITHKGEGQSLGAEGGADAAYDSNNHRSWHPVMDSTGRTAAVRNANANNWNAPFNAGVGTQTMYCTDCHGSDTSANNSVVPNGGEDGSPWGPHGSTNDFILKGPWGNDAGEGNFGNGSGDILCMRCHSDAQYRGDTNNESGSASGFGGPKSNNLHRLHSKRVNGGTHLKCTWCHVAVPHGWKNKALLVNLNDVGPECAGNAVGTTKGNNFSCEPYYVNAYLKVRRFVSSGSWQDTDCGTSTDNGKNWMTNNCSNPN